MIIMLLSNSEITMEEHVTLVCAKDKQEGGIGFKFEILGRAEINDLVSYDLKLNNKWLLCRYVICIYHRTGTLKHSWLLLNYIKIQLKQKYND